MMRGLLIVAFLLALGAHANAVPSLLDRPNQVCIQRPGETGRVNITPVTIIIERSAELTILGEQAVCLFSLNANPAIKLRFPYPYGGPGEQPRYWTTAPVSFAGAKGPLRLELCEAHQDHSASGWVASGWHDMWILKQSSGSLSDCSR